MDALGHLGIKAMRKGVNAFRSLPEVKKFSIAEVTELPTMSQQEVKKQPKNPSVPGVLTFPREKMACSVSTGSGMAKSCWFEHLKQRRAHIETRLRQWRWEELGRWRRNNAQQPP